MSETSNEQYPPPIQGGDVMLTTEGGQFAVFTTCSECYSTVQVRWLAMHSIWHKSLTSKA